jgi:5-methyltetrahydrofolate--homocysteine methyltransferase
VRTLQSLTSPFVSCYPNAGLPDEEGRYGETPDFSRRSAWNASWITAGSTWSADAAAPRRKAYPRYCADGGRQSARASRRRVRIVPYYTGIDLVEAEDSTAR